MPKYRYGAMFTDTDVQQMKKMKDRGMLLREIADHFNCAVSCIHKYLRPKK